MNTEAFVEAIRRHVRDAAIADTLRKLSAPPGRSPGEERKARATWFNHELTQHDRDGVQCVVTDAVDEAIFGVLAILDGSRPIAGGWFELFHVDKERVLLNDPEKIGLNEVFNAAETTSTRNAGP